jgi:hypothetical protein
VGTAGKALFATISAPWREIAAEAIVDVVGGDELALARRDDRIVGLRVTPTLGLPSDRFPLREQECEHRVDRDLARATPVFVRSRSYERAITSRPSGAADGS